MTQMNKQALQEMLSILRMRAYETGYYHGQLACTKDLSEKERNTLDQLFIETQEERDRIYQLILDKVG